MVKKEEIDKKNIKEDARQLEKRYLKRLKQKEIKKKEKEKKEKEKKGQEGSNFTKKIFSEQAKELVKKGYFDSLEESLRKANLMHTVNGYVSTMIFTFFVSLGISFLIMIFLIFFNVLPNPPFFVLATESPLIRLIKFIWIPIVIPLISVASVYFYPSLEEKSAAKKIDRELPLATLHMSSVSGSMVNPTEIFRIMVSTGEYPSLQKEFTKLINQINIYGVDIVTALRNVAGNCASKRLSELYNGLATNIRTGGDLPQFFNKRADTLLFEHKTEQKKEAKASETFMDIYISVVITAPMILMLLLMMMKISGLGIQMSTSQISLIMILGVIVINIAFLVFLQVRK